jgi:UDP-N-acetylglucosamine 2-epimerase (non-hydrolysing)
MKVMTILGTRPEIIRLSRVIPLLNQAFDHTLVHTGQNYDPNLNAIFFDELGLSGPDVTLDSRSETAMGQVGKILQGIEKVLLDERPDRVLILGDTNSALSSMVAKRMGIPVYHMEAGNRCFDDRVPEEVNRRIVDHSSDVLMPYTERSRQNLLNEGIASNRIYVTGNPIREVLDHYDREIRSSDIRHRLSITDNSYFLITLHRSENVDDPDRLKEFTAAFNRLHERWGIPIIWSVHPRTRDKLERYDIQPSEGIVLVEPLGLFDFVKLEKEARCVLSDSGTVQEECCIFGVPSVTLRDVTERPETIEAGSNVLSGGEMGSIERCTSLVMDQEAKWRIPPEYLVTDVSHAVTKILAGHRHSSVN